MTRPFFNTQDELSREAIVLDINKNLFVEAGAGSGKTTMLVNRMVAMIEEGLPVEKICAITFTKNAALEFYDRFQAKLIDRSRKDNIDEPKRAGDLNRPNDLTRSRCQKALENIDLCFMGTIDSFCNMILSEHPSEANIPSDARLISDDEAYKIYKKFYLECRDNLYGQDMKVLSNRFSMFYKDAEETFAKLMDEMINRRNIKFIVNDDLCIDFFKCFNKDREDLRKVLNTFNKDKTRIVLPLKKDDERNPIEDIYNPANEVLQKGWHYNYSGVEWALKSIADISYKASSSELGFKDESVIRDGEGETKVILNIKDEDNPNALLLKLQNYKYQNSLKLILDSIPLLEEKMKKEGKFTFFDYLYYLRNMLEKDAKSEGKLIEYIYDRHSYFLIDEFQDTNPLQAEIFFYLSAIDPKKNSWKDCKPKPGSLFIVGDPKQSIYRFRAADVSSYLNIKKMFNDEDNKVKYLINNFRSKNEIKSYFNDVFNDVMPEELDEQSKYMEIANTQMEESEKEAKEFRGLYTYTSYSDSLLGDYPNMKDEKQLALIVKKLVNNPNYKILDKGELRPLKYKDFMIIFAGKKNIASCMAEFNSQGILCRVEGKVLFEECEGLKTICEIYESVTDLSNQLSLIKVLYSGVFGLTENDLTMYKKMGGEIKLNLNVEYGETDIEKALNKLVNSAKEISTLSPSSLYEKIMDDYEIFRYVSSENLEVVFYTLELIRGLEISGEIITFEDATKYMQDLLKGDSGIERCLSLKQDEDAVHIANLHKVKGLEAPVVILTKAGSAPTSPSIRVEYKDEGALGYVISIDDRNSDSDIPKTIIQTNTLKEKADQEKKSLKKENDRLVYVAATRARNVLIVNVPKQKGRNGNIQGGANRWKALKEKINDDLLENLKEKEVEEINEVIKVNSDDLYKNFKQTEIETKNSYFFKLPSEIQSSPKSNEEVVEKVEDNSHSTLLGTIVHRLMEMIIMSKDKISKDEAINNILNEYVGDDLKNAIPEFKKILDNVYLTIHNGGYSQKGKAQKDILKVLLEADKCYSEVPFTIKEDNVLTSGIIDLIYEKDNKLHIIDFKTNKNDEDLDEHYKDQLTSYMKAVKLALNKEVEDALIYHIDIHS